MENSVPFYLELEFWSIMIASIAIILSQVSPVKLWFKKAKLEIDTYESIWISHHVGNPIVQINLILKNIGGRKISINKIFIDIFRDGEKISTLPLKNYLDKLNDTSYLQFGKFELEPNKEWNHGAKFLNFFSREDSKKYKEAERNIKNEIEKLKVPTDQNKIIKADQSFTKPFIELFDKHFQWKDGNYSLNLHIKTEDNTANIVKTIKFTIFESLKEEFESDKIRYESGDRIFWYSDNYNGEWIDIE
jgi:hypothetical protein